MSVTTKANNQAKPHPLLMIPGPIEVAPEVLAMMAQPPLSHMSPQFTSEFQSALNKTKDVFRSKDGQPFILAGSGGLGWDIAIENFLVRGDKILMVNTGYFSDRWVHCMERTGLEVHQLRSELGTFPTPEKLEEAIKQSRFKAIAVTHVDTSTAVLVDLESYARVIKANSPESLFFVDGVCSVGGEKFEMSDWNVDFMMTASQKALGAPPGLSLFVISPRLLKQLEQRTSTPSLFLDLKKWLPIMQAYGSGKPAYYCTPAVNNIRALNVALEALCRRGMENVWKRHEDVAKKFRASLQSLDLKLVAPTCSANTLSSIYYPPSLNDGLVDKIGQNGVVVAKGIHPSIVGRYFRVSHMGISVYEDHVERALDAIKAALKS